MPSPLHAELAASNATGCKVCAFLATCLPGVAVDWQDELRLPVAVVGNTAVVSALKRRGVDVTEASVRRHRGRHV